MDGWKVVATVSRLLEATDAPLRCDQPEHTEGHTCVLVADEGVAADEVFTERYPRVVWQAEPPMALPAGHVWDHAWAHGLRAVAVGQDAMGRSVVAVAERTVPPLDVPAEETSWVERLVAIAAAPTAPVPRPDWTAVESRLGTRLPSDYRLLVETYGCDGMFNGFFDVFSPDELLWHTEFHAEQDMTFGADHPPFPAAGGLIPWSNNGHEQTFFWITGEPDPDRWPVYAVDSLDEGSRFACTATEFLFRQMTDQTHPFHIAAEDARGHWFQKRPRP